MGASTVAPDAELSAKERPNKRIEQPYIPQSTPDTQRHNPPSDRVALTGKSHSKIKPSFSGQAVAYNVSTPSALDGQNPVSGYNWFPSRHLPETAGGTPVFFGSVRNHNSALTAAGRVGDFSSSEGYPVSGSNQGFPSGINNPGLPLDYGYAKVSSKDNSGGTITGKEQVPVPEPGTLVIVGSGLIALCYKALRSYL